PHHRAPFGRLHLPSFRIRSLVGVRSRRCAAGERSSPRAGPTMLTVTVSGLAVDEEQLRALCSRYGVARLEVFGSTASGGAQPDSDVDILYVLQPGARLGWRIEDLADELSAILGRPVDLVSLSSLNERLRDNVLAEAR